MRSPKPLLATVAMAALVLTCSISLAATRITTPSPGLEVWWSEAETHATTGVTVHLELLTGLEEEGPRHLGRTAALTAWLLRAPVRGGGGRSLLQIATDAGAEVLTEVDWRHASVTLWGPPETGDLLLWLAGARLSPSAPPVEAATLRDGLESLSGRWQDDAIGPLGDGFETIRRHMLGIQNGSTRLSSYLHATRMEDDALVETTVEAAAASPARVVVVASADLLERLENKAESVFSELRARPTRTPRVMGTRGQAGGPRNAQLVQQFDARRRLLVAWDLAPRAGETLSWPITRTAALLVLTYWARHPGSALHRELVSDHGLARELEARAWIYPSPALAVEAIARNRDVRDLRKRLIEHLEALAAKPMDAKVVRAAASLTRSWMATRWAYGPDRARLIGELVDVGEGHPDTWMEGLDSALTALTPAHIVDLARAGVAGNTRTALTVIPREESDVDRVRLDGDQIASYLRLMVDLRCPPPGAPKEISRLLKEKYGMAPRRYIAVTRAMASNPALMRDISEEAESRCQELGKLRKVLSSPRVVALHEAVVCGPGVAPEGPRGHKRLKRIWRKFDIDSSWYRPLLAATREDPGQTQALLDIDRRCADPEGGHP